MIRYILVFFLAAAWLPYGSVWAQSTSSLKELSYEIYMLERREMYAEVLPKAGILLGMAQAASPPDHQMQIVAHSYLASAYKGLARGPEQLSALAAGLNVALRHLGPKHNETGKMAYQLATAQVEAGQRDKAIASFAIALTAVEGNASSTSIIAHDAARNYIGLKRQDDAVRMFELFMSSSPPGDDRRTHVAGELGRIQLRLGRTAKGVDVLERVVAEAKSRQVDALLMLENFHALMDGYERLDKKPDAARVKQEITHICRQFAASSSPVHSTLRKVELITAPCKAVGVPVK